MVPVLTVAPEIFFAAISVTLAGATGVVGGVLTEAVLFGVVGDFAGVIAVEMLGAFVS